LKRSRRSVALLSALAAIVLLASLLAGGGWWIFFSDAGLRWAASEARSRSADRLKLEGVEGTLAGTVRVARVIYEDDDLRLVADNVEFTWSPRALLSQSVRIDTVDASSVGLLLKPGKGISAPPASLALPWQIEMQRASIAHLDVESGENRWRFARLAFHYSGGSLRHGLEELASDSEWGALRGNIALDASRPFAATGAVAFAASDELHRASASLAIGGTLDALMLSGEASAEGARLKGFARVAPFDRAWLTEARAELADVDLARFDARLPVTALSLNIEGAGDEERRVHGRFDARNAVAGPVSANRLPIASIASSFAFVADALALERIEATVGQNGRIAGGVRIERKQARWDLAVAGLDLRAIAADLRTTRLAGALKGDVLIDSEQAQGTLSGDLQEAGISLAFNAAVRGGSVDVRTFRARARRGTLEGRATFAIGAPNTFTLSAVAKELDPSAFGDYPQASLSGSLDAGGTLKPAWSSTIAFKLAEGSRLRGFPIVGAGKLSLARDRIAQADVSVAVGNNRLMLAGGFGAPGDTLAYSLDAPNLRAFDPRLGGRLRASGQVGGTWELPFLSLMANGESLRFDTAYAAATLTADIEIGAAKAVNERPLKLDIAASGARIDAVALRAISAKISGTLAHHDGAIAANASLADGTIDISTRLTGGWSGNAATGKWSGQILSLESRGAYALVLAQPAPLEAGAGRVHIAGVRGTLEGGRFAVEELEWTAGRLSSTGEFSALPAAPILAFAGSSAAVSSTLTFSGRWSFAATPRINGTLTASRDGGDLSPANAPEYALGLTKLELNATSTDDRVRATITARSRLADADIGADIGPASGVPGSFDKTTPLSLVARVDASSLRALQALAGTTAIVDGRIKLDLAGRGTLERVRFSGTIDGDALKVEAPQYGVYLKDGVVHARLADDAVTVSELSFAGGDGRFVASGVLPATGDMAGSQLTWKAEKLALFNRPDTRLTLSGAGTLAMKAKHVMLAGSLKADEGYFEFQPTRREVLGDDVVVRGREQRQTRSSMQRVPFAVDLELDFGDRFAFVGEGFDTGLAGKVRVKTTDAGELVANGTIQAVRGTYTAFGQRLTIERGELYFVGPVDNPGLDVFALRKNLAVEAGVEVTGTVRVPRVQLTSNPPVPDNEKLAWLVLGHGLDNTTGAEAAALQAALGALAGVGGAPFGQRIARAFGVDDISLRASDATRTGTGGQMVAVTKRLTDKLSLVYEQGLSVANNALKIEYSLSRNVTLRAEAGFVNGFGIYYSHSFD